MARTRNQRKSKKGASASSPSKDTSSLLKTALTTYRPVLDSLLFIFAVIGIIVTVHLWIQQEIVQFSQGCWGFNPPAGEASVVSDCALVAQSDAGKLFGVSNVYWGIGFYIVLAIMGFMVSRIGSDRLALLKRVRGGLITFGFFFSMYLVNYQFGLVQQGIIDEMCRLCLTSAAVAVVLFGTLLVDVFTLPKSGATLTESSDFRPASLYTVLPIVAVVLLVGDYFFFANKANSLEKGSVAAEVTDSSNEVQAVSEQDVSPVCVYDERYDPVADYKGLLTSFDPAVGPADASVIVIEYFDPNCPHCQALHPIMKNVIEKYKDRVLFVYKPFALRQQSLAQIEAMYVAKEQGKFSEMLDAQMALQETRGLPIDRVRELASDIGMDVSMLNSRMRAGLYRQVVLDIREKAAEAGLNSVPAVLINGRFVGTRSQECIEQFIEDAL